MTAQLVPTQPGVPYWSQTTNMDGTNYTLSFAYNQREAAYYLSLGIPNGAGDPTPLASFKIVSNWPLLRRVTNVLAPPGELIAACSPQGDTSPPGLNDFGAGLRVQLTYYPYADLL